MKHPHPANTVLKKIPALILAIVLITLSLTSCLKLLPSLNPFSSESSDENDEFQTERVAMLSDDLFSYQFSASGNIYALSCQTFS